MELVTSSLFISFWQTFAETIIIYALLSAFFSRYLTRGLHYLLLFLFTMLTTVAIVLLPAQNVLLDILVVCLTVIFSAWLFNENVMVVGYFVLLGNYFLLISDLIIGIGLASVWGLPVTKVIVPSSSLQMAVFMGAKLLTIILLLIYYWLFSRVSLNIPTQYWLILDLVLIIYLVISEWLAFLTVAIRSDQSYRILFIVILFGGGSLLTIYLFGVASAYYQAEQQHYDNYLNVKLLQEQLAQQQFKEKEMSKIRHDIRNNLEAIKYLTLHRQNAAVLTYLHSIDQQLAATKMLVKSGNQYIDAILNSQLIRANDHHIKLRLHVAKLPSIELLPSDIAAIMSNLLSNALEANLQLNEDTRYLELKLFFYKGNLVFQIINPYQGEIKRRDKNILSQKSDLYHRGLGITIVKTTVARVHGELKITYDHHEFKALVILPI